MPKVVDDPVTEGNSIMTFDSAAAGGKYGTADIVTKDTYRDFRLHIEFLVMMYFNGKKAHVNQQINKVWGGPNSGVDGGNDKGRGITDTPQGLKLQCEGHDVRYRNTWIKKLELKEADTDFKASE